MLKYHPHSSEYSINKRQKTGVDTTEIKYELNPERKNSRFVIEFIMQHSFYI